MTRVTNKKDSIYFQLLILLLVSMFASLMVFLTLNYVGDYLISRYYDNSDYQNKRNSYYIEKFQKYIDRENLTSRDAEAINDWVHKQKVISIRVYMDGIQVFDSEYPDQELWDEGIAANDYEWEVHYLVSFADGVAEISITGVYAYQFYNYALIAELMFSTVLFLVFVLLGIRKKMKYILRLKDEIEILEGGSLDYKITVEGKDELSDLAAGIDNMRISFLESINQEMATIQESQRIVTEMSHDLRTPVTSIMLYTEILKTGKYHNEGQMQEYVEKIDRKARYLKRLTDHLFKYTMITGEGEVKLEEADTCKALFYDIISETGSYLEQRGFHVIFQVEWMERTLQISTDFVMRIMDNLTSNIIKYADPEAPVTISSLEKGTMLGFVFENRIKKTAETSKSTGIGLQSVKNMMQRMNGTCVTEQFKNDFRVTLLFPGNNMDNTGRQEDI